ncbi:hypothetical protein KTC96_06665 [Clostridium estertheticum]|uniref:hypothetical protein n=1 Tax=Clostridium estertheticum TaxID=238834 RepID=UPI001C7D5BE7|nr:hypothetical protein [Clostridium estertheticum]MBX4261281.1 hypothetical protein [Clostridium estertheticum]WLC71678.1 hypothetical protein KTC96_06665 [Clostridium estertheticum]
MIKVNKITEEVNKIIEKSVLLCEDAATKVMINEENKLAYGFLGRTYLSAEINNKRSNSYTEFYSILNYIYENLTKAINIVK